MSFEKELIDRELGAIRKEIQRYKKDEDMTLVLTHLENIYGLLHKLYKVNRTKL